MHLDGSIGNAPAAIAGLVAFVALGSWFERRWNPMPPPERYQRDPKRLPLIAFWNMLDETRWTSEGVAFHRKRMIFTFWAVIAFVGGWLVLDSIW
jgi:hypothetical protein